MNEGLRGIGLAAESQLEEVVAYHQALQRTLRKKGHAVGAVDQSKRETYDDRDAIFLGRRAQASYSHHVPADPHTHQNDQASPGTRADPLTARRVGAAVEQNAAGHPKRENN